MLGLKLSLSQSMLGLRIDKALSKELNISVAALNKLARKGDIKLHQDLEVKKVKDISLRIEQETMYNKDLSFTSFEVRGFVESNQKPKLQGREEHFKSIANNKAIMSQIKALESCIILEDENIIALNKPEGIAVQGGSGLKFSIDDFLQYLTYRLPEAPRIVHRIDKDTKGIIIFAKTKQVASLLAKMFSDGLVKKTYFAELSKMPELPSKGKIECYIKKLQFKAACFDISIKTDEKLDIAITDYEFLTSKTPEFNLVKPLLNNGCGIILKPQTGRYHQLRAQMKFIGCPIVGDYTYGFKSPELKEQSLALYAIKIHFTLCLDGGGSKNYSITI